MNFKLRSLIAATIAGSFLVGFSGNSMADSTDDIVNALIAKGVLTEEEGALLMKGRAGEKEAAEAKKQTAVSGKVKDGGVVWESGDKSTSMAITGRVHFDMRSVDVDKDPTGNDVYDRDTASMGDQFELRRARIGVKGKMFNNFDYEIVANAVGGNTNIVDVAYLNWGKFEPFQVRVGQFKQPFTLEELTSSNNIDFMERSYANQLTPAKKPGVMVHGVPTKGVTYAASVFQQNAFGETDMENTDKSFAGRATVNFAEIAGWKDSVFHIGVAGLDSEYGVLPTTSSNGSNSAANIATNGTVFAFRSESRGQANVYRAQIGGDTAAAGPSIPSNTAAEVQDRAYGLELAGTYGPFKLQGEYVDHSFDANHKKTGGFLEADVKTYYVEALWMLTGENYSDWYKNGVWGGIKPKSNFDLETGKGIGAWEIGFRFDQFDVTNVSLSSGNAALGGSRIQGTQDVNKEGGAKTYTAGLKWTLNPNIRMLLNYSHTKYDDKFIPVDVATGSVDKEDLIMLRTQVAF